MKESIILSNLWGARVKRPPSHKIKKSRVFGDITLLESLVAIIENRTSNQKLTNENGSLLKGVFH